MIYVICYVSLGDIPIVNILFRTIIVTTVLLLFFCLVFYTMNGSNPIMSSTLTNLLFYNSIMFVTRLCSQVYIVVHYIEKVFMI